MNAVITEIRGAKAAALSDDGRIRLLENRNFQIGQIIEIEEMKTNKISRVHKLTKRASAWVAAAAAVMLITVGAGSYAYFTPVGLVSLDVNPSIEFNVNRFDRVLSVEAMNEDGAKVLEQLKLKNKNIEAAVKATLAEIQQQDYFKTDEVNTITIAAAFKNKGQEQAAIAKLNAGITEEPVVREGLAELEVIGVGQERVERAHAIGITPGRLNLIEKLQAAAGESEVLDSLAEVDAFLLRMDMENLEDLTVKDIMKEIKRIRMGGTLPEEQAKENQKNKGTDPEDANETEESGENPGKGKPETPPGQNKDKENTNNSGSNSNSNSNSNNPGNNPGSNSGNNSNNNSGNNSGN
jgi:hypothetical protein